MIAASPATSTTDLMHDIMKSYLLIVCVTLVLTMIISWFLSDMLTRPLKEMRPGFNRASSVCKPFAAIMKTLTATADL